MDEFVEELDEHGIVEDIAVEQNYLNKDPAAILDDLKELLYNYVRVTDNEHKREFAYWAINFVEKRQGVN